MPMNPDGTFSRIWRFVDQFVAGDKVRRVDMDTAFDDISDGLNGHIGKDSNPHAVTAAQVGAPTVAEMNAAVAAHGGLQNNPHAVTAAQVGAYTKEETDNKIVRASLNWEGQFDYLGGLDRGRFVYPDGTFSTTTPTGEDRFFSAGLRLREIVVNNKGAYDIAALGFYADGAPTNATPQANEFQLTPRLDVLAGSIRVFPVNFEYADLGRDKAITFFVKNIYGPTDVDIEFVFETTGSGSSPSESDVKAEILARAEFAGLPSLINRVSDNKYSFEPERFDVAAGKRFIDGNVVVGGERNIHRFTEDPSNATWFTAAGVSIDGSDTISINVDGRPVTLTRLDSTGFGSILYSNYGSVPASFVAGKKYLFSFYVVKATQGIARFYGRPISTAGTLPGHEQRLATEKPRRVWWLVEGASASSVYQLEDPNAAYSSGAPRQAYWFSDVVSAFTGEQTDLYVGGFQIEMVDDDANDGIIIVGDSTMAGVDTYPAFSVDIRTNGNPDDYRSLQVSRWLEMELNCKVFNRAIGGNSLDNISSRWATDVTPIAAAGNAKYVIIQGGINDIRLHFDGGDDAPTVLANLKASIESLYAKAVGDGLVPVFLTITPSPSIYGDRNDVRVSYNDWLHERFALVVDINHVIEAVDGKTILKQVDYANDGVHYGPAAKEAVGKFIARQQFWHLPRPSPYQPMVASSDDSGAQISLNGLNLLAGTGSPEGAVTAPVGSLFLRTDGAAGTSFYIKESGSGNTGWVGK